MFLYYSPFLNSIKEKRSRITLKADRIKKSRVINDRVISLNNFVKAFSRDKRQQNGFPNPRITRIIVEIRSTIGEVDGSIVRTIFCTFLFLNNDRFPPFYPTGYRGHRNVLCALIRSRLIPVLHDEK